VWPSFRRTVIALRALAERRLITTSNPYRLRGHVDEALRAAGMPRHQPIDTNTSINAMGAVRAGLGIAIIEPVTPASMPVSGLVTRTIDARIRFAFGAITPAGRPVSPLVQALISTVRAIAGRLVPDLRERDLGEPEDDHDDPRVADRLPLGTGA
jgi:DNA-binding transcriptional LysR family regulator